jgi:predicted secreted protein
MSVFQGVVAYIVIWWVVIFAVLPFGIRPLAEGEIGHDAGAPANPRLWRKVAITTAVTTMIWLVFFAIVRAGLISFRVP